MKVLVSLSCTMCPELVAAAQRIAAANPQVTADVYDLNHFPALREKYQVMSVPCLVVDDEKLSFSKKKVHQLLEISGDLTKAAPKQSRRETPRSAGQGLCREGPQGRGEVCARARQPDENPLPRCANAESTALLMNFRYRRKERPRGSHQACHGDVSIFCI